ncbi:hypothetical protein, partial [Spirosoma harenae]
MKTLSYRLIGEAELDSILLGDYLSGQYHYRHYIEGQDGSANLYLDSATNATSQQQKAHFLALSKRFADNVKRLTDSINRYDRDIPLLRGRIKSKTHGNRTFYYTSTELEVSINNKTEVENSHFLISRDLSVQKHFLLGPPKKTLNDVGTKIPITAEAKREVKLLWSDTTTLHLHRLHVYVGSAKKTPSELQAAAAFMRKECSSYCWSISLWDNQQAFALWKNKQNDAQWLKKNWVSICEHKLGEYRISSGELMLYPLLDAEY